MDILERLLAHVPQGIFQKGQDAYRYFSPDIFFGIYTIYFR